MTSPDLPSARLLASFAIACLRAAPVSHATIGDSVGDGLGCASGRRMPSGWRLSRKVSVGLNDTGLDSRLAGSGLGAATAAATLPLHLPFLRFVGAGSVQTAQLPHLFGRPPLEDIRRGAPLRRRGERGYHPKNAAWPHQFRSGDGAKPQSPARKTGLLEPITSAHSVQFCTIFCLILFRFFCIFRFLVPFSGRSVIASFGVRRVSCTRGRFHNRIWMSMQD